MSGSCVPSKWSVTVIVYCTGLCLGHQQLWPVGCGTWQGTCFQGPYSSQCLPNQESQADPSWWLQLFHHDSSEQVGLGAMPLFVRVITRHLLAWCMVFVLSQHCACIVCNTCNPPVLLHQSLAGACHFQHAWMSPQQWLHRYHTYTKHDRHPVGLQRGLNQH